MSDRDGIVLYAASPARLWHVAVAGLASIVVCLAVVPFAPSLAPVVACALTVGSVTLLTRPRTLVFRARVIELRWLHTVREIPYLELAGLSTEPERVRLRLRGGGEEVLDVRGMGRTAEAIGVVIRQVTGLSAEGEPPAPPVERSEQLVAILRVCGDAAGFVDAFARAEPMLRAAGLDVTALGPSAGTYRTPSDGVVSPELLDFVRLAEIRRTQLGGGEITPLDVLLAMYLEGAPETHVLIRAGLAPMRLVDHVAHHFSPAESDARAAGEVSFTIDAAEVALEILDDPFTPTVVAIDLLEPLVGSRAEAERLASEASAHGRARAGSYERIEGERRANALMKAARRIGSPLRVELTAIDS